jgi:hypothetical protein
MSFTSVIRLFFFGNYWIALGAALLSLQTLTLHHISVSAYIPVLTGGATLVVYCFARWIRLKELQGTVRSGWLIHNGKVLLGNMLIGCALMLWCLPFLTRAQWLVLICAAIPSLLYAVSIYGFPALRSFPLVKIFLISWVWAAATVFFPAAGLMDEKIMVHGLAQALFIFGITIPFDIRDLKFDAPGQKTIPQVLGVKRALLLSTTAILSASLLFIIVVPGIPGIAMCCSCLFSIPWCLATIKPRSELYYSAILDGLIVFQAMAGILFS